MSREFSRGKLQMRILFVSLTMPFPPQNGLEMRTSLMLRALAADGHRVALISFASGIERDCGPDDFKTPCDGVDLVPMPSRALGGRRQYRDRLRALASPYPYGPWRFKSAALHAEICQRLAACKFDAIICDEIYQVQNLPLSTSVPILLNKHTMVHEEVRRYLEYESSPLKCAYGWLEYHKLRQWESLACKQLTGVLACSDRDRDLLAGICPSARMAVVPNCVDTDHYSPALDDDGKTMLFVGAMDWIPNQDAVNFFAAEILPRLRRSLPKVRLVVAGRNPPEDFRRRFADFPEIEFSGTVADLRPLLAKAAVSVVPLRIGSGTRIKILEAAAAAKPIVSTAIGCEGLKLTHRADIMLADEPATFATAVVDLFTDTSRRRRLGLAARERVVEEYSFPVMRSAIRRAFHVFIERRGTSQQCRLASR